MRHMSYRTAALAALMFSASPALAREQIVPSAYPELASAALLPPLVAGLKRTLKDPYSVCDLTICRPRGLKLKAGGPVRCVVMLSFNAKNSYGGYEGVRIYSALFRNGRISGGLTAAEFGSSEGLAGLINNAVARQMATCPTIPDEQVQQILSGSLSTPN